MSFESFETIDNSFSRKKRLLQLDFLIGQPNRYKPGKLLTAYATVAYHLRNKNIDLRNGCVPSNSFSNSFKNKSTKSSISHKKEQKTKSKEEIHVHSNVENQSTSYDPNRESRTENPSSILVEYMRKIEEEKLKKGRSETTKNS